MSEDIQSGSTPQAPKKSALPIIALVIGIIALVGSWMPILNNGAFVIGLIGLIFAIIGFVKVRKNPQMGNGIAIAGLIVNILALIIVLATQSLYGAAWDEATSGPSVASSQSQDAGTDDNGAVSEAADYSNMKVGKSVTLDNGMVVTVKSVKTGLVNYDGKKATCVTVSYKNNSDEKQSFNLYDWSAEDSKGAQRDTSYYSSATNELHSGDLKAGGSVTGNVYFDGTPARVVYTPPALGETQDIGWKVK